MYAMVEIKGKQYRAEKGRKLKVDRLKENEGDSLEFDNVMLIGGTENVKVGNPYVDGVKVKATVEEHGKGKKVIVFKYKKRKNYKRKLGHRQAYSFIRVDDIIGA